MIDASGLREALAGGATLPADWYSDPAIVRLEQERIFTRSWQYVGRVEQVAEPGDFFSSVVGTIPVVVVCDREGRVNGFVNVCRHRGHIVADGVGRRKTLQCPYHAWTYDLDGSLRNAPRSEREPGFDHDEYSLFPVSVDSWGPLLFANPGPAAVPLAEALGSLPRRVEEGGLDVNALRFRERAEWTIESNWKITIENYLECYHCSVAHPGFSKVIDVDPDAYLLRTEGLVSSQFGSPRPSALAGKPGTPYDPRGEVKQAQYHLLWPNTTFNVDPGPPNLSVDATLPDGPVRSRGFSDYFFAEDVSDETARAMIEFASQVGREDASLVESVQRGLASGMVPHGRLLLASEHLIQHFQGLVAEALLDD